MRFAALGITALLLTGCSWGANDPYQPSSYDTRYAQDGLRAGPAYQGPAYQGPVSSAYQSRSGDPRCQLVSPTQPLPQGCSPSDVTYTAQFGSAVPQSAYQTGSYGSSYGGGYGAAPSQGLRGASSGRTGFWGGKRFRVSTALGIDPSVSGDILPQSSIAAASYSLPTDPYFLTEGTPGGERTDHTVTITDQNTASPSFSISDIYGAPTRLGAGLEFDITPKFTAFAEGSLTKAPGQNIAGGTVFSDFRDFQETYTAVTDGMGNVTLVRSAQTVTYADTESAFNTYNFGDLEKAGIELGGRYYFDPVFEDLIETPLTPYVSASAGAANYNEVTYSVSPTANLDINTLILSGTTTYTQAPTPAPVTLFESQWVGTGSLMVGAEWRVFDNASVGIEGGVRYESAREYEDSLGIPGDTGANITTPVMLRGRFGF